MIEELNLTISQMGVLSVVVLVLLVALIRYQTPQEDASKEFTDKVVDLPTDTVQARYGAVMQVQSYH